MPSGKYYVRTGRPAGRPKGATSLKKDEVRLEKMAGDVWRVSIEKIRLDVREERLKRLWKMLELEFGGEQVSELMDTVELLRNLNVESKV